jgi:hypothetical protein
MVCDALICHPSPFSAGVRVPFSAGVRTGLFHHHLDAVAASSGCREDAFRSLLGLTIYGWWATHPLKHRRIPGRGPADRDLRAIVLATFLVTIAALTRVRAAVPNAPRRFDVLLVLACRTSNHFFLPHYLQYCCRSGIRWWPPSSQVSTAERLNLFNLPAPTPIGPLPWRHSL